MLRLPQTHQKNRLILAIQILLSFKFGKIEKNISTLSQIFGVRSTLAFFWFFVKNRLVKFFYLKLDKKDQGFARKFATSP